MSSFAAAFRVHVIPEIRRLCKLQGLYVALGVHGFAEAHSAVLDHARRRGSNHLPDDVLFELEDFICTKLLDGIVEFETIDHASSVVADKVALDIRRWEALWAKSLP